MQKVRLETKDGSLVSIVELPTFANGEPDALMYGSRVFIRKAMQQIQPPIKNSPECYVEGFTMAFPEMPTPAPTFDKVTEVVPKAINDRGPREHDPEQEEEGDSPALRRRR